MANQQDDSQEATGEGSIFRIRMSNRREQEACPGLAGARLQPAPVMLVWWVTRMPQVGRRGFGSSGAPGRTPLPSGLPDPDSHRHAAAVWTGRIAPRARFVHQTRHPGILGVMESASFLGGQPGQVAALIVGVVALWSRRRRWALALPS